MSLLKVKKVHPSAKLPRKAYDTDAAYDLSSVVDLDIEPGKIEKVDTGIQIELPYGTAGFIWDRSGLGSKGIHRFAGLVDYGFSGNIMVCLYNSTDKPYHVNIGDRIAQLAVQKVEYLEVVEVDELTPTNRGDKGFNSSGT